MRQRFLFIEQAPGKLELLVWKNASFSHARVWEGIRNPNSILITAAFLSAGRHSVCGKSPCLNLRPSLKERKLIRRLWDEGCFNATVLPFSTRTLKALHVSSDGRCDYPEAFKVSRMDLELCLLSM